MKAAYFHGYGSEAYTERNDFMRTIFDSVYDPPMDYEHDSRLFEKTLKQLQEHPVDILIGSSMGGWFAYALSTHLGIPTLLFNPAVHSRSFEPPVTLGTKQSKQVFVLGNNDTVINPRLTLDWISLNVKSKVINFANMGHRVDLNVFKTIVKKIK